MEKDSRRNKILFISSWFPNKLEPTNGNFVQRHAEAVSLYNDVEILHAIGDFAQQEIFVFEEQFINGIKTLIVYYKNSKNPAQNFIRRMKAYKLGFKKMQKPDLVHANVLHNSMLFAVYLKRKFGIPFVVSEHWTALRKINAAKTPVKIRKIAKIIGNQAEKILPVSNDLANSLKNIGIKTKMKVIPNVVNTKLFTPNFSEHEDFTFIHISNLIPRKNAEKILKVAIKLMTEGKRFRIQIGGDGEIAELQKIAEHSGFSEQIEIFGIQTSEQVAERMRNSDCFILFSDDENQPCVIAEAFASGIRLISTNVGGIAEFFPENAGILLQKVDEELLENAMREILSSKSHIQKNELSEYAQKIFSKEAIGKKFSDIYEEILSK